MSISSSINTPRQRQDDSEEPAMTTETIHETVRQHYADAAIRASQGSSCCSDPETIGANLYTALERDELPDAAVLASLGCGNPTAVADLRPGERVLDLGSGGGIDVLLSAKRAVFAEIARVLRPGGRIGISDIVAEDSLTPAERAERGSFAGCIAGALSMSEFRDGLTAVGLTDVSLTPS